MTIKELLAARTAPGKWEVSEDDEYVCVTMDGPDDYTPLGYPDERNTADARAIVAMDHIIDPALAVVEAARKYQCFGSCDEAECPDAALNNALVAFDAAVEEATR